MPQDHSTQRVDNKLRRTPLIFQRLEAPQFRTSCGGNDINPSRTVEQSLHAIVVSGCQSGTEDQPERHTMHLMNWMALEIGTFGLLILLLVALITYTQFRYLMSD